MSVVYDLITFLWPSGLMTFGLCLRVGVPAFSLPGVGGVDLALSGRTGEGMDLGPDIEASMDEGIADRPGCECGPYCEAANDPDGITECGLSLPLKKECGIGSDDAAMLLGRDEGSVGIWVIVLMVETEEVLEPVGIGWGGRAE